MDVITDAGITVTLIYGGIIGRYQLTTKYNWTRIECSKIRGIVRFIRVNSRYVNCLGSHKFPFWYFSLPCVIACIGQSCPRETEKNCGKGPDDYLILIHWFWARGKIWEQISGLIVQTFILMHGFDTLFINIYIYRERGTNVQSCNIDLLSRGP